MHKRDKEIINEFKQSLPDDVKTYVKKLIIFGSRARGNAADDSDLDIAILVIDKNPEIEKKLEDIAYAIMMQFDFNPILSLKVFDEKEFNSALENDFSFYRHVVSEGITI